MSSATFQILFLFAFASLTSLGTCNCVTSISSLQRTNFEFAGDSNGFPVEHIDDIFELLQVHEQRDQIPLSASIRMLYTYKQQANIFKEMFCKNDTEVTEILERPDSCNTIQDFIEFTFNSAFALLSHGAGRQKEQMRAFQQVLHMRYILKLVLGKEERSLSEDVSATICVDKVFIAAYAWVHGYLISEARALGTWRDSVPESTMNQSASLEKKRTQATTTTLNVTLDPDRVKPLPGVDYSLWMKILNWVLQLKAVIPSCLPNRYPKKVSSRVNCDVFNRLGGLQIPRTNWNSWWARTSSSPA